jgi:PAS domain S-box-containing protein
MKTSRTRHFLNKIPFPKAITLRNAGYLLTPIIAMVVFALAMGMILWSLNNQEKNQQNLALFRELAFAKQRIQIKLTENEEKIAAIGKSISNNESNLTYPQYFVQETSELLNKHPEIIQIKWVTRDKKRVWTYPSAQKNKEDWLSKEGLKSIVESHLIKTLNQTKEIGHAEYSELFQVQPETSNENFNSQKSWLFWYIIPPSSSGEIQGHIAVLYSANNVLVDLIPKDLTSRHRFSIVSAEGKFMLSSSLRNLPKNTIKHEIPLDKIAGNVYLRGESFPLPSNIAYRMLLWLVIGLCLFVLWSLWSIWKQMKYRQETEKHLIDETNFRRAVVDSMPLGIRIHDTDAKIRYVNPAFCRMIGWTAEDLIDRSPPYPFWSNNELPQLMQKFRSALEANQAPKQGIEAELVTKSGQVISTRTYVSQLIDAHGKQVGWICSIVDVSEPKRIREELAVSHQRFTTVLEGLEAAVSVINPKTGELLFANELYQVRFGDSSDGHLKLAGDEMHTDDASLMDQDNVDAFAGLPASALTPLSGEAREVEISENHIWYEVRRRYIPWTDGHLAQLIIATDITRRHQAEEKARIQEEKMQFSSRLTTMGEMASSLAHELNQPLAAINNYCMGVISRLKTKNDKALNAEIIPALEKAGSQAIRAGSIIQRIRSFVKRSSPQNQMCNLEDVIQDAVELSQIEVNREGFEIATQYKHKVPEAFIDPILIQQVLVNLIKNGLDSMREKIPRHLRSSSPAILVKTDITKDTNNPMLRIQVIDAGKGIPEDVMKQIYEPFYSTKIDGMGMGLNICRSIIESHKGRLWAENCYPKKRQDNGQDSELSVATGCTFTILLPILTPLQGQA